MGLLCDPKHPVFKSFPTEFHTDWQWFDILVTKKLPKSTGWMWSGFDTYGLVIENLPNDHRPLIQPIDQFYRNKRLGLLVEGVYGKGKLMICCADLDTDTDRRIAAPHLKQSILNYMNSNEFEPTLEFKDEMFEQWFDYSSNEKALKIKFASTFHGNKVADHAYHWYTAVHTGEFEQGRNTQVVMFDQPKAGRNIRFVALEGINKNDRVATLAEFELITEELKDDEDVP